MATDIEIFIGTSQDFLLSFKVKKTDNDEHVLERYIAHRCHNGPIIAMDTKGRYLATGGGDDRIVVIDLKLNRDVHEVICHEGSVNSLLFTNKGNDLLSGSEDGRLVATAVGSWKPIKSWKKPHTGKSVLKVCLHLSDKFALTLGKDGTLRGWDMIKGTQINTFNTKDLSDAAITLDNVELSPDGLKFAMSGAKTVTIMSLTGEEPYDEITLKSRASSMCWLDGQNLLIGLEDGSIEWLDVKTSERTNIPDIHNRRVKGMDCLNGFLGTICTSGAISLWATTIPTKKLTLICTIDEGIRPTCIKLIDITENRYKEKFKLDTEVMKESLPRSVKNSRPISTTGKLIVETDGNENSDISKNQNLKQEIADDDTDTEIVITSKKSLKRKKSIATPSELESTASSNGFQIESVTKRRKSQTAKVSKKKTNSVLPVSTTAIETIESEQSEEKKEKDVKNTVQKPIVVRSPNLDDDFENVKTKQKKRNSAGKPERQAVKGKIRKLNLSEDSQKISTVKGKPKELNLSLTALDDATPIRKKKAKASTPMSCPAIQQSHSSQPSKKKRQKLDFDTTEPAAKTKITRKKSMSS